MAETVDSIQAISRRVYYSAQHPCEGGESWHIEGLHQDGVSSPAISPERILRRSLGTGSRIQVTVEVLHEVPLSAECLIPWHGKGPFQPHRSLRKEAS